MSGFSVTAQQRAFFDTFGYLAFPGLFADDIADVSRNFERNWEIHGGGHNNRQHEGTSRSCLAPFIDQTAELSALVDDPRILGIATSLLGDDFNYMGSDGNYYVGDTGWHSDGWHHGLTHVKLAFYLDPVGRDTGCLRVIPGSHRLEEPYAQDLHRTLGRSVDNYGVEGRDIPAVALETVPGDLVCFNHNTKHAAFGGGNRRRMFTINLCERYPEDRLPELRDYISGAARFWVERAYGRAMMETAGPARMRHLEQVMANDGHIAALAAKARETMAEPARG